MTNERTRIGAEPLPPEGDIALERLRAELHAALGHQRYSKLTARAVATLLVLAQRKVSPTVGHIGAHLGLQKPSVSRATDRLEGFKLVTRRKDPNDLRSSLIELTDEGDGLVRRARLSGRVSPEAPHV